MWMSPALRLREYRLLWGQCGAAWHPKAPMMGAAGAELPPIKLFKAGVAERFLGRAGKH